MPHRLTDAVCVRLSVQLVPQLDLTAPQACACVDTVHAVGLTAYKRHTFWLNRCMHSCSKVLYISKMCYLLSGFRIPLALHKR